MSAGWHRLPCRIEVHMSELRAVRSTPWWKTSAFKAWWKSATASLTIPATGGMPWKAWAISVGVSLAVASYEIIWGPESFRDVPSEFDRPPTPPDPMA